MTRASCEVALVTLLSLLTSAGYFPYAVADGVTSKARSLWAHDNLVASGLVDSKSRSVEERAQMLQDLGIRQITLGGAKDNSTIDTQIETLKRHHISVIGWFVEDFDEPAIGVDWKTHKIDTTASDTVTVGELLETLKRHGIKPQLWVARNMRAARPMPQPTKPVSAWTDDEKNQAFRNLLGYDPTSPEMRYARVRQEADHIKPLAQLAAAYGLTVALYKHGGWIGIEDNLVDVIERLKAQGISNVGMVYRFIHAHDEVDDTVNFPAVWKKIQPFVLVVDITGLHAGRTAIYPILYPSQGPLELDMMKIIRDSGWRGPIGVSAEKGAAQDGDAGDAGINLRNNLIGLDWIAAELKQPGSGGTHPFSPAP
jgi:hypothetical protein